MKCPNCDCELPTFGGQAILVTDPPLPRETVVLDPIEAFAGTDTVVGCSECLPLPTREGGVG